MAVPLHNHTYFSAYDGLSKPKEIADRVVELGYEACGCTDHGVVAGHIEFYKAMEKVGVKPLLGIEAYQAPVTRHEHAKGLKDSVSQLKVENFHLLLLAQNDTGLRNLWAMNTEAHATGFFHSGRVDWQLLEKFNEGILCTSACSLGMIQQALKGNPHIEDADTLVQRYLNIFGDRFYLELSTYPEDWQFQLNIDTVALAKTYGVPLVYANDAHYATPDQYELHEAIIALQQNKKLSDPPQSLAHPKGRPHHELSLYIQSEDEIQSNLNYLSASDVQEAMRNTELIASQCNVTLPQFRQRLPMFVPDKPWKTGRDMLFDLVQQGFAEKVKENFDEYFKRVEGELEVIYSANLVDYFLLVRDYVQFANSQGILVGPGRGSVGGSLIAYLIGITQVDPIRYGLIFERFYNAGRETSLPDIDIDFPVRERESIKKFLMHKYGKERVADLGTVIRLGPKSAVNDMARVLSIPKKPDIEKVSKIIDEAFDAGLQPDWDTINEELGEKLAPYKEKYPQVFEWAEMLSESEPGSKDDHIKTYGTHASGVVIADEPLGYEFPLRWVPSEEKMVSQWDMRDAEHLGFQKVDILGLRNLDTLDEVNNILREEGQEPIDFGSLQDVALPEEMWQLLDKGQTTGIFQVEEGGQVKGIAKKMKVRSIEDAALLTALNRPGPLRSGAVEKIINHRKGGMNSTHHPYISEVCEETGGVLIYQEQVIQFFQKIGYSLLEADDIRALMGKKKVEKLKAEYPRYIKQAIEHMTKDQAELIWNDLVGFAKYAFNKSHSVEYAVILMWCVYAKWLHPRVFTTAAIRTAEKKNRVRFILEAQRMKIPVYQPTFGKSKPYASLFQDGIMLGYADIQDIGVGVAKWLTKHSVIDMTTEQFETIMESDEGKITLPNGRKRVALTKRHIEILQKLNMFSDSMFMYTPQQWLELEEEYLKAPLSDESIKVLEEYRELIDSNCVALHETEEQGEYTIAGVIREIVEAKTKQGKEYAKVHILDDSGDEAMLFVWNNELKRLKFILRNRTAGMFHVKRTDFGLTLQDAAVLHSKSTIPITPYARYLNEVT